MKVSIEERFWAKATSGDGCWEWMGPRVGIGYGSFWANGKTVRAHRLAWELVNGPIPTGLSVLHRCDNPPCVRPDHLFIGTNADNSKDMVQKGRSPTGLRNGKYTMPERTPRGERHGSRTCPGALPAGDAHWSRVDPGKVSRGERNGWAKLTEEQVKEIRATYKPRVVTQASLGEKFGVTQACISLIVRGQNWA